MQGEKFEKLAEGYYTAAAIENLCRKHNVEMPICQGIYRILYENANPDDVLESLFSRSLKNEF